MRNVTILLAVVAMLAATAQAVPTVAETFSTDPGWTHTQPGAKNFDYDDTAKAITGNWNAGMTDPFRRYYTPVDSMTSNVDGPIYFGGTYKITNRTDGLVTVGLFNTTAGQGEDNKKNAVLYEGRGLTASVWIWNSAGDSFYINPVTATFALGDTVRFELETFVDGASNRLKLWTWKASDPRPDEPTMQKVFYGASTWNWTVNAFGTADYWNFERSTVGVVDDLYLNMPIPEPATMVLLGLGGIGVLLRRRRK